MPFGLLVFLHKKSVPLRGQTQFTTIMMDMTTATNLRKDGPKFNATLAR